MRADHLISHLSKVRKSGKDSWIACCPAHPDKTASLSIKDVGDGRVLINCFAGCGAIDVLESLGLDWEDVMPETTVVNPTRVESVIYPTDALRIIKNEARLVYLCALDISKGNALDENDMKRLKLAMDRILKATELSNV